MQKDNYDMVIFDWDGTLMDSTAKIIESIRSSAAIANMPAPSEAQIKSIIGLSMPEVMRLLFPQVEPHAYEHFFQVYWHHYSEINLTPSPRFDGALEIFQWLKA